MQVKQIYLTICRKQALIYLLWLQDVVTCCVLAASNPCEVMMSMNDREQQQEVSCIRL